MQTRYFNRKTQYLVSIKLFGPGGHDFPAALDDRIAFWRQGVVWDLAIMPILHTAICIPVDTCIVLHKGKGREGKGRPCAICLAQRTRPVLHPTTQVIRRVEQVNTEMASGCNAEITSTEHYCWSRCCINLPGVIVLMNRTLQQR